MNPLISVLMPAYKTQPHHLREAIDSILTQTYYNFELLILDDCPEDKTVEEVVKSYSDERIKYFRNEKNLGIAETRNRLMDISFKSTSEFIAIADHDDIQLPTRFEKMINVFEQNPHIGVVGTGYFEWWEKSDKLKTHLLPEFDFLIRLYIFLLRCGILGASMVKKELFEKNNLRYLHQYSENSEQMMWMDLLNHTQFYNIQEPLMKYRWHDTNSSVLLKDREGEFVQNIKNHLEENYKQESIASHIALNELRPPAKKSKKYKRLFIASILISCILLLVIMLLLCDKFGIVDSALLGNLYAY
jgi:glycosyltransferase involved in cell wall biosynthesis